MRGCSWGGFIWIILVVVGGLPVEWKEREEKRRFEANMLHLAALRSTHLIFTGR